MISSLLNSIKGVAKSFANEPVPEVKVSVEKKQRKERIKKSTATAAKFSDKEIANKKKEPWVDVIAFRINKDNIRNGFYELDWNDYFVAKLKDEGYGFDGDPDEEIVERWFREICITSALAEGIELEPDSVGSVDISKIKS